MGLNRACKKPAVGVKEGKMIKTVCLFDPETHARKDRDWETDI